MVEWQIGGGGGGAAGGLSRRAIFMDSLVSLEQVPAGQSAVVRKCAVAPF